MEESISLEETNKIRISLGLKPLTDDSKSAAPDDPDKLAQENYRKVREQEAKEKETKCAVKHFSKRVMTLKQQRWLIVGNFKNESRSE
jgi:U4/U6.U5 tri-snRNP-associated protein 1